MRSEILLSAKLGFTFMLIVQLSAAIVPSAWAQDSVATDEGAVANAQADSPADESDQGTGAATADPPATDAGQADLDEAVLKRLDADTEKELEAVSTLLESALAKGLSETNTSIAKKMLSSIQLRQARGILGAAARGMGGNPAVIRNRVLELLNAAVENDDTQVEAHYLIAQLNIGRGGDIDVAKKAATRAIELWEDDPKQQSMVYGLRSQMQSDPDQTLADLTKAIEVDPSNTKAVEARIAVRIQQDDVASAIDDLKQIVQIQPLNLSVFAVSIERLLEAEQKDSVLELIQSAIDSQESPIIQARLYRIRSRIYSDDGDGEASLADLNRALELEPDEPTALLQRAQLAMREGDAKEAKRFLQKAIDLEPQLSGRGDAILLRYFIASSEERVADAINEVKKLVDLDPFWQQELGRLYIVDDRPRKAIEVFDQILESDPDNADVLRSRGDALLGVGKHADAIADYEKAIKLLSDEFGPSTELQPSDQQATQISGILNNLSWVLATSPDDSVRQGWRALELAKESARLTDYSKAHILSTLAAAYAETGDLQRALEYSRLGVDIAESTEDSQIDQLREELETYREGKPWREKQDTKENDKPILGPEDLIEI